MRQPVHEQRSVLHDGPRFRYPGRCLWSRCCAGIPAPKMHLESLRRGSSPRSRSGMSRFPFFSSVGVLYSITVLHFSLFVDTCVGTYVSFATILNKSMTVSLTSSSTRLFCESYKMRWVGHTRYRGTSKSRTCSTRNTRVAC